MARTAMIVGAGLTGASAAWRLIRNGFHVRVFERAAVVGGHVRTEWIQGIPYEPHGAHIFHTSDEEVWNLVSKLVTFLPYRHRVVTRARNHLISWPPQTDELAALADFDDVIDQIRNRPAVPDGTNFETYCVSILGQSLYEECVRGYSRKQWGRDPTELSAAIASGRIELRSDGYRDLFRDPYQGWPRGGYTALVEALLDGAEVVLGHQVTITDLRELARPGEPVVITSALDDFLNEPNALEWRGVRLEAHFQPRVVLAQPAMVVNEPDVNVKWTRSIETKWAVDELHARAGTVVLREYPGAKAKHYPLADVAGKNLKTQVDLIGRLRAYQRSPLHIAGRLGTYRYINMDAAVRDGLNVAETILKAS